MANMINLFNALAGIGALLLTYLVIRGVDNLVFHLNTPSHPLLRYRAIGSEPTYALITGGNGGIGFGTAKALLQRGFGVILLGRNGKKLNVAAEELLNGLRQTTDQAVPNELVKTIVLDPQLATGEEIRQAVQESIVERNLHVSILVNNVGSTPVAYPPFREHVTYSSEDIDNTIALNAGFMAHLTACMIPVLTKIPTRALILNLCSGGSIGVPYQVMYSATKGFNASFSKSLSRELEIEHKTKHIDVLNVLAGDVHSQSNELALRWGSPDSMTYGRCIVEKTDGAVSRGWREMAPYWKHHLDFIMLPLTPDGMLSSKIAGIMKHKRAVVNEAMTPKN